MKVYNRCTVVIITLNFPESRYDTLENFPEDAMLAFSAAPIALYINELLFLLILFKRIKPNNFRNST